MLRTAHLPTLAVFLVTLSELFTLHASAQSRFSKCVAREFAAPAPRIPLKIPPQFVLEDGESLHHVVTHRGTKELDAQNWVNWFGKILNADPDNPSRAIQERWPQTSIWGAIWTSRGRPIYDTAKNTYIQLELKGGYQ